MKSFKSIFVAAIAAVMAVTFALPALPVSAQSASLSIAPKKNYVIEPGKSQKDTLVIRNLDKKSKLDLSLRVVDFTYTGDGGTPKLMLAPDAQQTTWSLKPFLKVPTSVSIPAGGSKTIDINVSIPAGHGAGSYYSAIVYSTGAPDGGNVGLSASGVTLAFVNIPGQVNEDLKLEKLGAYTKATADKEAGYHSITMDEPQMVAYTLKNSGNVTEAPVGSITLKSMFGKEYKIDNINPNLSLALIGQSRTFTSCIELKDQTVKLGGTETRTKDCTSAGLWPGYYSVALDAYYGQNGNTTKEVTGSSSFWYLPLWFIIVVLVLVVLIAVGIWLLVRKIRNHKPRGKKHSR